MSRRGRLGAGARLEDYAFDDDFFQGKVVAVGAQAADFLEVLEALEHAAEDGVLSVERRHGFERDVKLAAVGNAGGIDVVVQAGGGDGAFSVRQADFGGDGPSGTARAAAGVGSAPAVGIAGLHEGAGEGAVELHAPVVAGAGQLLEIFRMERGRIVIKPDDHAAQVALFADFEVHDHHIGPEGLGVGHGREERQGQGENDFHERGESEKERPEARRKERWWCSEQRDSVCFGLAPGGDPRQSKAVRVTGRREWRWWAAVAAVVVLAFAFWQQRGVEITGRVSLLSWDGTMSVPQPARALVFSRGAIVGPLREHLARQPAQRASAAADVEEARKAWREKSTAREEALRILRVAQRANAADLAACRERHDEAARAADEAYAELERGVRRMERLAEPAVLLAELTGPVDEPAVAADGSFALRARVGQGPVVVVVADGAEGPEQAWLQPVDTVAGGEVEVDFSNANLLTARGLRDFLGWRPAPEAAAGGDHGD